MDYGGVPLRPVLILAALLAVSNLAAANQPTPEIVDSTNDPVIKTAPVLVWLTHPAIDFEWIDLSSNADDMIVVIKVQDIDSGMSLVRPESGSIGVWFGGSAHDEIDIVAWLDGSGKWTADAFGWNDGNMEFWEDLNDPVVDTTADTFEIHAPRSLIGSSVIIPRAASRLDYREDISQGPEFQFGDQAGPGSSYFAP